MKGSPRLLPHTPSHTSKNYSTQLGRNASRFSGSCSVGILVLRHQRQGRLEKNEEIEQHSPILNVVEIELDTLLDFFLAVDLAAPAVDLGPAGNARLDAVTREISVHGFVEQ